MLYKTAIDYLHIQNVLAVLLTFMFYYRFPYFLYLYLYLCLYCTSCICQLLLKKLLIDWLLAVKRTINNFQRCPLLFVDNRARCDMRLERSWFSSDIQRLSHGVNIQSLLDRMLSYVQFDALRFAPPPPVRQRTSQQEGCSTSSKKEHSRQGECLHEPSTLLLLLLLLACLMGQYCFARWRLLSVVVVVCRRRL